MKSIRSKYEDELRSETCAFIVIICELFLGLVGNIIACIVIVCSRSQRSLTDVYLLNLTITDLVTLIANTLICIYRYYAFSTLTIAELQHETTDWLPDSYVFDNRAADYISLWIAVAAWYASLLTVVSFTIERCLAIRRPFLARSMSKTSRVRMIIGVVWSISALFAIMLVAIRYIAEETAVELDENSRLALNYAEVALYCLCFIVPNLAITVICISIGRELKKSSIERPSTHRANRSHARALKMFAIIVVVSFLSWTPLFTQIVLVNCSGDDDTWDDYVTHAYYLTKVTYNLPSVLNPVIYTIMSSNFREALKDLLSKTWKKLDYRTTVVTSAQTDEIGVEMSQLQ